MEEPVDAVGREVRSAEATLAGLGLAVEDLTALRRQGFVSRDARGHYKLRYRLRGKQRVRYLGSDAAFADQVRQALSLLQAPARLNRELGQLVQISRRALRDSKGRLAPLLESAGYGFHG